jgi:hypothetical protein
VGFVEIEGFAAGRGRGALMSEEGCEVDGGRFAGFGVGCRGLKKSRIDLLPTGGMIHFR